MRVRILSGNARGSVQDLPDAEALQNVESGFAEMVPEIPVAGISTTLGKVTVSVPKVKAAPPVKARVVKPLPKPAKRAAPKRKR